MPVDDVLTPMGASYIATNAYFTLKDCMRYDPSNPGSKPQAAPATRSNGQNRVFGPGNAGRHDPRNINPTLHNTGLASANLSRVFSGNTGLSTCSGFCYLLQYKQDTRRHVVIAPPRHPPGTGRARPAYRPARRDDLLRQLWPGSAAVKGVAPLDEQRHVAVFVVALVLCFLHADEGVLPGARGGAGSDGCH
jgi:hypothetical protein